MARGRMVSKSLSTSKKWNALPTWFSRSLYILMVVHADDYGIVDGDAEEIKWKLVPAAQESSSEIEVALCDLKNVGLLHRYEFDGHCLSEIVLFDEHQEGLHKRTKRKFPPFSEYISGQKEKEITNYSEQDIEGLIASRIEDGQITVDDEVLSIERQKRIGNSYIDLLVHGKNRTLIIEVKRSPISNSAIEQAYGYLSVVRQTTPSTAAMVIGCGLAANVNLGMAAEKGVGIFTISDALLVTTILPVPGVNVCYLTLNNPRTALGRVIPNIIELNLIEEKERSCATNSDGPVENSGVSSLSADADGRAAKASEPKKLQKPTDPRIKQFIDCYHAKFLKTFGSPPKIDGPKDGKLIKALLEGYDLPFLLQLLDSFFVVSDEWLETTGYTIGVFSTQVNKLIVSNAGGPQKARANNIDWNEWRRKEEERKRERRNLARGD